MGGVIITDPVAGSTAPGQSDVVALGMDYTPYHFVWNGSTVVSGQRERDARPGAAGDDCRLRTARHLRQRLRPHDPPHPQHGRRRRRRGGWWRRLRLPECDRDHRPRWNDPAGVRTWPGQSNLERRVVQRRSMDMGSARTSGHDGPVRRQPNGVKRRSHTDGLRAHDHRQLGTVPPGAVGRLDIHQPRRSDR